MGIDYVIDLACAPKQAFTARGLLDIVRAKARAKSIIKLYRDNGDMRPPSEMGFEMERRTPDGDEEVQVIIVQDLLDQAAIADPYAKLCENCPANIARTPFGCYLNLNYPLSLAGETWLLKQLPTPEQPLLFLLLQQTVNEMKFNAEFAARVRSTPGVIMESGEVFGRRYDEVTVTTDHIFQLLFYPESIQPAYGALLLLLFGAIPRTMTADEMLHLTPADPEQPIPFLLEATDDDDQTILALKAYLAALHRAHALNVSVSLDA